MKIDLSFTLDQLPKGRGGIRYQELPRPGFAADELVLGRIYLDQVAAMKLSAGQSERYPLTLHISVGTSQ